MSILTAPRFSIERPLAREADSVRRVRAAWISDVHLGTRGANFVRRRFGLGYWSLSAYAKKRVKDAVSFIGRFEEEIVRYAKKFSVDAVLCGHIHNAAIRQFSDVTYYNCGDWVESCSALIEREDGTLELVNYHPFSAALVPPVKDRPAFNHEWTRMDTNP